MLARAELCFSADWACTDGNFGTLREIALRLRAHVPEPHRRELDELGDACRSEPERAAALWAQLRPRVCGEDERARARGGGPAPAARR